MVLVVTEFIALIHDRPSWYGR